MNVLHYSVIQISTGMLQLAHANANGKAAVRTNILTMKHALANFGNLALPVNGSTLKLRVASVILIKHMIIINSSTL